MCAVRLLWPQRYNLKDMWRKRREVCNVVKNLEKVVAFIATAVPQADTGKRKRDADDEGNEDEEASSSQGNETQSNIYLFSHSFIHSFIHSCIHLFIFFFTYLRLCFISVYLH